MMSYSQIVSIRFPTGRWASGRRGLSWMCEFVGATAERARLRPLFTVFLTVSYAPRSKADEWGTVARCAPALRGAARSVEIAVGKLGFAEVFFHADGLAIGRYGDTVVAGRDDLGRDS
jgi:hypothetical protein